MLVGQLEYPVGEGGREQQILALAWTGHTAQQEADVLDEAEIEHPIGLVHHHHLDGPEAHRLLLHEIDQPARGRDDDIYPFFELTALFFIIDPAIDQRGAQARMSPDLHRVLVNLDGQLTRGRQNDGPRVLCPSFQVRIAGEQAVEERDQKSRRLAGAGLGLSGNVPALQRQRQGHGLNGRTADKTGFFQPLQELRMEGKVFEADVSKGCIRHSVS